MKIIDIRKTLPSKGSLGKMDKEKIDLVIIHHDGVKIPFAYNTFNRLKKEAEYHIANGSKHLSYHYAIDNIGDVYYCVDEKEVCYHAGNYPVNLNSIAIVVQGNFEQQNPTARQIKALQELLVYLTTKRPDLPKVIRSSVKGHKEVRMFPTACPGKNLYPLIRKF